MNFYVLTLFPEMIEQGLNTSIIGRALDKGLLSLNTLDIRDFSENKHNRVDDYPYGGGAGMVMAAGPVYRAHEHIEKKINSTFRSNEKKDGSEIINKKTRVVYLTPQGSVFNQNMAEEFAREEDLIFLCGHYEGIDERVLEMIVTDYVSIGDYVLTGGELPAMVMMDAIARLVPGVLNNDVSAEFESFQDNLLEYPQYTRPEVFMEKSVPEVLLSGHHARIEEWRKQQSILRTAKARPDLLEKADLTQKEKTFLDNYLNT
ncbi:MAG: tRNA (guanosine(37)-N1)-methyltransferase TrmD [Anaerocolumna sp.]